ncbi:MAG: redoxin domain-containing protein [Planctomycetales bacterium]|nr:redoxin domain-containing protein [Planctomycetales bacterium]MCA9168541.1 redoxin domain-containing protein [Planctomycetales bacterium]
MNTNRLARVSHLGLLLILAFAQRMPAQAFRPPPDIQSIAPISAPSLDGGVEWLNVAGPLSLPDLRGKIVVLDFWTYCCINCMQILPDLQRLEREYPEQLVVIGVHAPKFLGERDTQNVREAILRYGIEHPVVNDANAIIARKYGVASWPTLRVIDPSGNVIATHEGEATFATLNAFMKRTVAKYRRAGNLDETPLRFALEREQAEPTPLRFPGKVLVDPVAKRLYIADSGHHRIVVANLTGKMLGVIGTGRIGRDDGTLAQATFSSPQGMALRDNILYVADTENHAIRQIDLRARKVTTIAGTGEQAPSVIVRSTNRPRGLPLASPWALALDGDELYIAMAGSHQIWRLKLTNRRLHTYAGNGVEDIVDGPLLPRTVLQTGSASFAQPSGLASDGQVLFVADSEGSSIRAVALNDRGRASTLLGTAALPPAQRLFTFGDRDGNVAQALLQHPLGIAYDDQRLFVADTYNNKIKVITFADNSIVTIAGTGRAGVEDEPAQFNEPSGLAYADGILYVADTNNHLIRRIHTRDNNRVDTLTITGLEPPAETNERPIELPAGRKVAFGNAFAKPGQQELELELTLNLPVGAKLNPDASPILRVKQRGGDAILANENFEIKLESSELPLRAAVPLTGRTGTTNLEISLGYYYCETASLAVCKLGSATWSGELRVGDAGTSEPLQLKY